MIPKKIILAVFILCGFCMTDVSYAQSDLRADSVFFKSKKEHIVYWLEKTGVDQLFAFRNFDIQKNKLVALFDSRFSAHDSTLAAIFRLNKELDSLENNALEQRLFNMLAFELELGKDSLELILGANHKGRQIFVSFTKSNGIAVNYDKILKNTRTFKPIVIQLDELSLPSKPTSSVQSLSLKDIRIAISDFLKNYYASKGTFFYDAQLDILKENTNEFTFEVSKLSKEILTDRDYFEYIRIEVKLVKTEKEVEIKYQILGKYSGGFGFAPRRSEYRNMEPDYSDYLQIYEEKISQKIIQLLTK